MERAKPRASSKGSIPLLRLITRLNIGGPARQALLLTKELRPDFDSVLAAGTPAPHEGELSDPEVAVSRVQLVRAISPSADARAYSGVRNLIAAQRPAIIHTHMAKAGTVGRSATLGMRNRPRLVHTFHGHVLEGYFRPTLREAFLRTERHLARRTDALVAVSDEIRNELLSLGIGRPEQWRVIPLGFDLSGFSAKGGIGTLRKELGIPEQARLLGIVGRLVPIKDLSTSLRAIDLLPPEVHLAIVGDGEERPAIERAVEELTLGDRVHFLGWRKDIAEVMDSLDVAILSSRNEGSPVALIEALASGVPVVATDVGGVRSVVQDGISGYLVTAGDFIGLADRARRLLDEPAQAREMGDAGRAYVMERFDQKRLVADIRALYEDLLT